MSIDVSVKSLSTYAKDTALTKEPLSAGEAMSFMTPYAIEKVPWGISVLKLESK
jgi:hypothetical protein